MKGTYRKFDRNRQYLKASLGKRIVCSREEGTLSIKVLTNADYGRSIVDKNITSNIACFWKETL